MNKDDNLLQSISEEEYKKEFLKSLNIRFDEIRKGINYNDKKRKSRKKSN